MLDDVVNFAGRQVLVVGDIMLDEYVWGRNSRVSPEAPIPIIELGAKTYSPGGAGNVAANVSALRGIPTVVGVIGHDPDGDRLAELLADRSVFLGHIPRHADRLTTVKTRILADGKQIARIDQEVRTPVSAKYTGLLCDYSTGLVGTASAAIISDYGKGVVTDDFLKRFLPAAKQARCPVVVDPKGSSIAKYRGATLIKPNLHEAGLMVGRTLRTDDDVEAAGRELLTHIDPDNSVLITRGPQGMTLFRRYKPTFHMPAHAREVFDVTGAGDTVAAVIALALGINMPLPLACELANRAAAIVVQKVGTATLTQAELRNPLATQRATMYPVTQR